MTRNNFREQYKKLEQRFQRQANSDGDLYLPNVTPSEQVDFVFIAMEPSLYAWADSVEDAEKKINKGFRNFLYSFDNFLLHHAVKEYLCSKGQTYHITDISKGAMRVKKAKRSRKKRYLAWYPLLMDELALLQKPNCMFFSVGKKVETFLNKQGFDKLTDTVLHYSSQNGRARKKSIEGKEDEFSRFTNSVTKDNILHTAADVLNNKNISEFMRIETMARLQRSKFTESRKMLLFSYWSSFQVIKETKQK